MNEGTDRNLAFLFPAKGIEARDLRNFPGRLERVLHYTRSAGRIMEGRLSGHPPRVWAEFKDLAEIYALSCASCDLLRDHGIHPSVVSGYSLGVYSALYAAGVYAFEEGVQVLLASVSRVLEFLDKEGKEFGMGGIIGLTEREIEKELFPRIPGRLEIACYNGTRSFVVSGHRSSVQDCLEGAEKLGAFRTVLLETLYAYHMSFLQPLAAELHMILEPFTFLSPRCTILSPLTGEPIPHEETAGEIVRNFHTVIRWDSCMRNLVSVHGVKTACETGPGDSLMKMNRHLERGLDTVPVERLMAV